MISYCMLSLVGSKTQKSYTRDSYAFGVAMHPDDIPPVLTMDEIEELGRLTERTAAGIWAAGGAIHEEIEELRVCNEYVLQRMRAAGKDDSFHAELMGRVMIDKDIGEAFYPASVVA